MPLGNSWPLGQFMRRTAQIVYNELTAVPSWILACAPWFLASLRELASPFLSCPIGQIMTEGQFMPQGNSCRKAIHAARQFTNRRFNSCAVRRKSFMIWRLRRHDFSLSLHDFSLSLHDFSLALHDFSLALHELASPFYLIFNKIYAIL